ncbi:hypothetical protein EON65_17965 [archaeon]|nr:MAG: hypothetical protein EON65_17965 [archaeon]
MLTCFCLLALSSAFRSFPSRTMLRASRVQELSKPPFRMTDDLVNNPASNEDCPVDRKNIESAAAVTGGVFGLLLLGPLGATVLAALANYVAKKEDDAGEAVRGIGKTALESIKFVAKLNNKFQLTEKVTEKVGQSIDNVASENKTIGKVRETASNIVWKLDEINKEFGLVNKGKDVVAAAATLSDAAIEKTVQLYRKVILFPTIPNTPNI